MEDWELIVKYIKNEVSEQERIRIELWLNENEQNKKLFNEVNASWDASGKLNQTLSIDKTKAWQSIQQKIKEEEKVIPLVPKKSNYNAWILRAAAILVVGLFATWYALKVKSKSELILVQTTNEQKLLKMPDGSSILLNKNSTLIYPKEFTDNERKVNLEGEAFFEVTKNQLQPFIIENKQFDVKVLGTSFDVKAYQKDKEAVVTVVTGKVSFSDKQGNAVVLIKDEIGILNKNVQQLTKHTNTNLNGIAWKTKLLEFNNTPVYELCQTLENYFSIKISVKDVALNKCKFTGSFNNAKLGDILKTLEITLNLKIAINGSQVAFSGKGC